jgi:hypothetical protein
MTAELTDLDRLERDAFRRFYEDGIVDVHAGSMLVVLGIGALLTDRLDNEASIMIVLLALGLLVTVPLLLLRRSLLRSRLGTFRPGPRRRHRIAANRMVLVGSLVLGVVAFGATAAVTHDRGGAEVLAALLPAVWFVNAVVVFGAGAYLLDVPRFLLLGLLIGTVMPALIWPDLLWGHQVHPMLAFGVPGAAVVAVGLVRLVRFLRDYPVLTTGRPDPADD